jgi:hypothetical protein
MLELTAGHDDIGTSICQAQSLCMTDAPSTTNNYGNFASQIE